MFKPSKCPRSFRQSQRQNRDSTLNYCHLHPASKLEPNLHVTLDLMQKGMMANSRTIMIHSNDRLQICEAAQEVKFEAILNSADDDGNADGRRIASRREAAAAAAAADGAMRI